MKIIGDSHNLVIREFLDIDAFDIFQMNSDAELMKMVHEKPYQSIDEASYFIEQMLHHYQEHNYGLYGVYELRGGRFVGWCGLRATKYGAILNVRIKRKFWNKGYATEALNIVIDYATNQLKLPKIAAKAQPQIPATQKILEKTILKPNEHNPLIFECKLD
ncbi:GNAT family N-acetyltransferase [Vaginella massiliensis]|uniref:GNAT family N-acetyltransferase n=1 Tax=Vaginella massiliensis TaxID=1816680 RepID=UPI0008380B80|nr:GNAT family N-acetyltransferase [Vaginella massiliensis]